jgi:hypothetical protein
VKPSNKVERVARLQWIPLAQIDFNELAQRNLKQSRVDELATDFDPEQVGYPTVNHRAGRYYVVDGHHRVEALKIWLGEDWEQQQVQCQTYEDLSEEEEAEVFLKLNNVLAVTAFDRFRIGVKAGRPEETDVDQIVRQCMLRVSQDKGDGAVGAVGTLMRVYRRGGPQSLARTLLIIRDAYGDPGLEAAVLDGIGLLCHRFNGDLNDAYLIERMKTARGGVSALLGKAETLRKSTGSPQAHCVAAAAVEINNGGRGGKKLPDWWKANA